MWWVIINVYSSISYYSTRLLRATRTLYIIWCHRRQKHLGSQPFSTSSLPLHLYQATLSVHGGHKGVFDWHYLQCVTKRFVTLEYESISTFTFMSILSKRSAMSRKMSLNVRIMMRLSLNPHTTYCFDRFMAEQGSRWWSMSVIKR